MSAPGLTLAWGTARVELDPAGGGGLVDGEGTWLRLAAPEIRTPDGPLELPAPTVTADADEVELAWSAGPLRVSVRHSCAEAWSVRVVLASAADTPVQLADVRLGWRTGPGRPARVLAAGALASYAVFPPAGTGPVLSGRLRLGDCTAIDADGPRTGPLRLEPGARYVVQWNWTWAPTALEVQQACPGVLPPRTVWARDDTVLLQTSEDEAVLVPEHLVAGRTGSRLRLGNGVPGCFPVEVRSARGVVRYTLTWVDGVAEASAAAARRALDRTGPRALSLDEALAVQQLVLAGEAETPLVAEEALEAAVAEAVEADRPDPRAIALLCGEHQRLPDPGLLDRATAWVLAADRPRPGLGLAGTQLCLTVLAAGRDARPVLAHLARLAGLPSGAGLAERAATLELGLLTTAREEPEPGGRDAPQVAELAALGGWLGAGCGGSTLPPLRTDVAAHLAAVFSLAGPASGPRLRALWGCDAAELGRRAAVEVLARLAEARAGPALSWLAMVRMVA